MEKPTCLMILLHDHIHSFLDVAHHDAVVEIKKSLQYYKYISRNRGTIVHILPTANSQRGKKGDKESPFSKLV